MAHAPQQPPRETFTDPDELAAYDMVVSRSEAMGTPKGVAGPYFGSLLQSPILGRIISEFGRAVRQGENRGTYSHADREFVDMILSKDLAYYGVLPAHIPDGLAVGVRLEAIEAIFQDREEDLNSDEKRLATFIRAVISNGVTDERWNDMLEYFGGSQRTVLEYTVFIAFLEFTMRMMSALEAVDVSRGAIDELIADYREGRRELPNPDIRINA